MKLLIVDDHDINLKLLRAQLEAEGHVVEQAVDGVEALEALEREPYDGVVSDILMPRMDGYRLCMEVRSRPALVRLPFVLYTSTYNSPGDRKLAESLGADAYLAKPAATAHILEALAAAMRGRPAGAERRVPALTEPAPLMKQYNEVLIRKLEEKGVELERTHEGLLETQARLSGLIASAMDAIIAVDEQYRIVLFNAAAGRMFHCDPDATIGRQINDFIPMRSRDAHDRHIAEFAVEHIMGRSMGPRDVMALRADGSEFPIEANISRLPTSQGQLFTAFIRDVTERRRAQAALQRSEAGLRRAQDVAQMAHAIVNARGEVEQRSESFAALLDVSDAQLPRTTAEWLQFVHPEDASSLLQAAHHTRQLGQRIDVEYRLRRGSEWRRMRHILEPLEDRDDEGGIRTFNTIQDVTAERQTQDKVRQLNRVYAVLSGINSLIVRTTDRDQLLREACRILIDTGGLAKAWIGMVDEGIAPVRVVAWAGAPDEFFEDLQRRLISYNATNTGVLARVLAGGQPIICNDIGNDPSVIEQKKLLDSGSLSFALLPLIVAAHTIGVLSIHSPSVGFFDKEETDLLIGLASDISFALDHLMKAERINYLATHDALTGLPNRNLFAEVLSQRFTEPARGSTITCVALLDLVRFRRINETLGRGAGDDLLVQIGARLHALDPSVARVGPDVFALLFEDRRSAGELARDFEQVAKRCFEKPFYIGGEDVRMGCRIGAAVHPGDGDTIEELLRNAESALRKARTAMEPFVFYAVGMNTSVNEALALESKLRRAIDQEEFVLYYQPKLRLADRSICGAEALIRWQDPECGLIPPMRFIPILEETGLIGVVGRWALQRALADAKTWRKAGAGRIRVAVNVSPLQLNQPNFAEQVAASVAESDSDALELEITESVIMDDVERKIALFEEVGRLGVTIAIDDFGTGYSSLGYISRLPINSLKIDRAFVTGMTTGPQGYILVSSIIALAHALKLKVVAEGVNTEQQAQLLKLLDCDEAQGYLFSEPVPTAQLLALLLAGCAKP
jgi:diguanylate cyclase (GGDEF)-like protein/PAS domain S-box-containing protein